MKDYKINLFKFWIRKHEEELKRAYQALKLKKSMKFLEYAVMEFKKIKEQLPRMKLSQYGTIIEQ